MPLGVEECGIPYKEFSYVKFPTYNLLPRVDSTLVTVDIEGDKVPFSSLAMDDCVSPQSFPRSFCVSPFLFPCLDHFFHQLDYKIKLCLFLFAEDPVETSLISSPMELPYFLIASFMIQTSFLSLRALVMPFLLSSRVIYEPNFVRFILASFPDAAANSSLNSGTGCFHVKADLYSFICPLVCPNGSPGRVDLKKKT